MLHDKDLKYQTEQIESLKKRVERLEESKNFKTQPSGDFQAAAKFSCRVCREGRGCRTTTCSDPT
ncbi:hypothetical protein MiSe_36320 [Microseira wollei NIES-4236]|uniref:Transposase n=1 Tax=Microseira wollei NIES-4236 TaxID=2530354 RepID=A0AAV3X8Z0_9CYAN|nr:hypothetical protein MiSe_36320 [Microseira wollei NIES-4236]